MQLDLPVWPRNCPTGQAMQLELPVLPLYCPMGQAMQQDEREYTTPVYWLGERAMMALRRPALVGGGNGSSAPPAGSLGGVRC